MATLRNTLTEALRKRFRTPKEAMDALGLDSSLLTQPNGDDKMGYLSHNTATAIASALKAGGKLALDADISGVADLLRQIEGLEGDRRRSSDTETGANAGIPPWLSEHPDDEDDTLEESEEDNAADRRVRAMRTLYGRDETEEEAEENEGKEEQEADDALHEFESARREAADTGREIEDRRKAEDRMRHAEDKLRRIGADARRRAEDRRDARDRRHARDEGLEPPDLYEPDTSHTLDKKYEAKDRQYAKDRRRLGRDYRRARDAHRKARDAWQRYAGDWKRARDARREAEGRRHEAEDAKRAEDVKRAEDACQEAADRMQRAAEDGKRAEDLMHRARDMRRNARDARRHHAADQPPDFKGMPKAGGEMITKAAMDAAIDRALRDSDHRHRSIMDALEAVRPKVGKIAMDSNIQNECDVYALALDALGVPHTGITQLSALKQIFVMAQKPGTEARGREGFAMDTAPKATNYQRFKELFPAAVNIERM